MDQEPEWDWGQNGPKVKMGYCCLPPERVELTVNSKKETNCRVKMGYCCLPPERVELTVNIKKKREMAGSNWAESHDGHCG